MFLFPSSNGGRDLKITATPAESFIGNNNYLVIKAKKTGGLSPCLKKYLLCHPERSEGSLRRIDTSNAALL